MTPQARTKQHYNGLGYSVGTVERWNAHVKRKDGGVGIRQDLFGFIDLIVMAYSELWAVQVSGYSKHAEHRAKILSNANAPTWLRCGGRIFLVSWYNPKRGDWQFREEEINLLDFENGVSDGLQEERKEEES